MNKQELSYLMDPEYKILLDTDKEKFSLRAILATHFNVHYMGENIVIVILDDGSQQIVRKYTINDYNTKFSYYNLPSEIDYDFHSQIIRTKYFPPLDNGSPDIIVYSYSSNHHIISTKYYWNDEHGVSFNPLLNRFFNDYIVEKVFDITVDYNSSDLFKLLISEVKKGNDKSLRKILKDLDIRSIDHIQSEYTTLIEMLRIN